jgi:hypothetical protein
MIRLNNKAFEILCVEVERCANTDAVGQTEKLIVIKRLEKLRLEKGYKVTFDELHDTVSDIYPQFSDKVIKKAIKANKPSGIFGKVIFLMILLTGSAGFIWVVNLPNPMIRKSVSKTAPILLIPSFISMDYNYREAIDTLGQAEQLLDNPTSAADIERGEAKVKQAKKHLDQLPVWFLGYYPETYCNWLGCSWKFTFDEFETARKKVARLDAIAFQNQNALNPLQEAEQELKAAKQEYTTAKTIPEKEEAISAWKKAITLFEQIPAETIAGRNAEAKLKGYKQELDDAFTATYISAAQEFDLEAQKIKPINPQGASKLWQQALYKLNQIPKENSRYLEAQKLLVSIQSREQTVANSSSINYIEAAKQYAFTAATITQKPPHPAPKWKQSAELWNNAISQLKEIDVKDAGYVEAQKLIAQYQSNLGIIEERYEAEKSGQEIIVQANRKIQNLIAFSPSNRQQWKAEIQGVINQLETVRSQTTSYPKAQRLITLAQRRLQNI